MDFLEDFMKGKHFQRHGHGGHGDQRQHYDHGSESEHDDHPYHPTGANHGRHPEHGSHGRESRHYGHFGFEHFLSKLGSLAHSKTLRAVVVIGTVLVIVIGIATVLILLPLIAKVIEYVSKNGIQGLAEATLTLLKRLWTGNG